MEVGHGFIVLGKLQEMSGNKKTLPDQPAGKIAGGCACGFDCRARQSIRAI